MPALNHALMIPGLIVVTLLFWAWIPVWALVRCLRRATKGPPSDEERLRTGHVPHRGFDPPPPEEIIEFLPPQDFADSTPLLGEKPRYDDFNNDNAAAQEKKRGKGREDGIKTVEARMQKRQEEEERAAAVMKEQTRRHREERRERRERDEAERRREKGKGRALSVSEQSMMDSSSAVAAPESVVTRENSRRHHHSRR